MEKEIKILGLPLKKEWYDMIESGEKTEEYREIKPYWCKRFLGFDTALFSYRGNYKSCNAKGYTHVRFRYGYTKRTMLFPIESITIGTGNPKWGAADNEVFIIKLGKKECSYEFVDLGLPSGTLWATKNVGATSETDYGLYFQWGDTQGYTAEQVGIGDGQTPFNWVNYKYCEGDGIASNMTKYNITDKKRELDTEDDAATVNMGSECHMPTNAQFQELKNNTDHSWVTDYKGSGVNGMLFTSRTNSSKTLFFPAYGYCLGDHVNEVGQGGYYWLKGVNPFFQCLSKSMHFNESEFLLSGHRRNYGFLIRGVK